ncbi:MAG: alpha-L-rhamnosidase, partial [Ferruginibacter sp.]
MNKLFLLVGCFIFTVASAQLNVQNPLLENQSNPIGIDILNPRFSWQISSDKRNILQSAYEIKVTQSKNGKAPFWNSGKVTSAQSVHVPYSGPTLQSAQEYYWQVRVWTDDGKTSPWSKPASWQMGLLSQADWKAKWIQPGYVEDSIKRPSPLLRTQFTIAKKI